MALKKCTIISLIILICLSILCGSVSGSVSNVVSEVSYGDKVICSATLNDEFTDDEIVIIVFPEFNDFDYSLSDFSAYGCIAIEEIYSTDRNDIPTRMFHLRLGAHSKKNVLDTIELLQLRSDVYCAEPNYLVEPMATVNDPQYVADNQWAIGKIDLPLAWNISTGSNTVMVGVIDSGIDGDHPDLVNRVNQELSYCFSSDYTDPLEDATGHGTHVAGIIGAQANNSIGVTGVCWNVELVSLRAAADADSYYGKLQTVAVIDAIYYAEAHDIPILNLSANTAVADTAMRTAISCYSGLFVTAAGNSGVSTDTYYRYPSGFDLDNILSVGNSTSSDERAFDSNYGATTIDIFAPGSNILSTVPGGGYGYMSGTSMAAPYVAGVAALLLSEYPTMTTAQLKAAILHHAEVVYDEDGDSVFGNICTSGGRLNAYNTLNHNFTCLATTSKYNHDVICSICNFFRGTESHSWITVGAKYRCTDCGKLITTPPAIQDGIHENEVS